MATRTITIIVKNGNHFDVHEGERYADSLCWDEMLGQIASMTHPEITRPRYNMLTPEDEVERQEMLKRIRNNSGSPRSLERGTLKE